MGLSQGGGGSGGGGGATSPGGSDNQVQYNNGGAFGGNAGLAINESTSRPVLANGLELTNGANTMVLDGTPTAARTITLPDATTTLSGRDNTETLENKSMINPTFRPAGGAAFKVNNPANTFQYLWTPSAIAADRTITIPLLTGNDTVVMAAFPMTLTNKEIDAANNTISNIANANVSSSAAIAGTKIDPNFGSQNVLTSGYVQPGFIRNSPSGVLPYPASGLIRMRYNDGVATHVVMAKDASSVDQVIVGFGPFNATQFGNDAMNALFSGFATILAGAASIQVSANGASVFNCDGSSGVSVGVPLQGSSATSAPFRLKRASITLSGDLTLTAAQYSCPYLDFGGALALAATVTTPNTGEGFYIVRNNTGQALTIKRSGGTGVTIAAGTGGRTAIVFDNGTDIVRVTADA